MITYANVDVPKPLIYSKKREYGKYVSPIFSTLSGSPNTVPPWNRKSNYTYAMAHKKKLTRWKCININFATVPVQVLPPPLVLTCT